MGEEKDFKNWHKEKVHIETDRSRPFFYEREVWWCSVGVNVGHEQNGGGHQFIRPVLIFKAFSKDFFLGIPLTRTIKKGVLYQSLKIGNSVSTLLLSQMRPFDAKRLCQKMGVITKEEYMEIKKALTLILFG